MATALQPHRFNSGFTWEPVPRLGSLLGAADVDAFERDGFVLVPGVFDTERIAAVRAETDRFEADKQATLRGGRPPESANDISAADAVTFTELLVGRSPVLRAFAADPVFGRLCADLLAADARLYWDQAVYKHPEPERDFPWHQDTGYVFTLPQHYLTCWVPLVDATADNGAPEVAPGLHRDGTLHHWRTEHGMRCLEEASATVVVEAQVGDVVCFSSLTPHRTGPNRTDSVRKAYILQYAQEGSWCFTPTGAPVPGDDRRTAGVVTGVTVPA